MSWNSVFTRCFYEIKDVDGWTDDLAAEIPAIEDSEIEQAVRWIAKNSDEKRPKVDHLIRAIKQIRMRNDREAGPSYGECSLCLAGWMSAKFVEVGDDEQGDIMVGSSRMRLSDDFASGFDVSIPCACTLGQRWDRRYYWQSDKGGRKRLTDDVRAWIDAKRRADDDLCAATVEAATGNDSTTTNLIGKIGGNDDDDTNRTETRYAE